MPYGSSLVQQWHSTCMVAKFVRDLVWYGNRKARFVIVNKVGIEKHRIKGEKAPCQIR